MTRETMQGHPADPEVPAVTTIATLTEEIDTALLSQARHLLGGSTEKDAVDEALAELIRDRRRRQAVTAEISRFEAGQFATLQRPVDQP
jgi:Arc/MetJ family transcription regulator